MGMLAGAALASTAMAGDATVDLPDAATTSAGVFDEQGRLVRTLWSGQRSPAGPLRVDWDGRDDDGRSVAATQRFRVRVLAQHIRYLWEGVIGNTSKDVIGPHVHRALNPISAMAIDRYGDAFYVVSYNEQQNAINRFDITEPQRKTALAHDDYRRVFRYASTDGSLAYFANVGLVAAPGAFNREPDTFVIALDVATGAEYVFARGRTVTFGSSSGNRWSSVIDYDRVDEVLGDGFRAAPSGLAVQQRGRALFVSHGALDEVRAFDKRSGEALGVLHLEGAADLAIAPDDSLWALSRAQGAGALAHLIPRGSTWVVDRTVTADLSNPVAIGVSPVDGTVVVADAGTEQLKAFSSRGERLWTYGERDAYRDGRPQVTPERLWLSAGKTYVAFAPDGSFWFGDPGNDRNLHLSPERHYREQLMYLPASYHCAVDAAHPRRVFSGYLEFDVDYAKPLASSWTLTRNWGAGLAAARLGGMSGFRSVVTLRNARTYAVRPAADPRTAEVVELAPLGTRRTDTTLEFGTQLYADGSLRSGELRLGTQQVYIRNVDGFDASGDPRWADATLLASVSGVQPRDPYYHDVPAVSGVNEPRYPQSTGDVVIFFNPGRSVGFHLGGVRAGGSGWLWRASPVGSWMLDAQGAVVSSQGTYELGRGVQYLGNVAVTADHQVVYGYHGEAWNGGQANQFEHFRDDGLFVGQFGLPVYPAQNKPVAHAGSAGNAFSPQLVSVGGRLYLWHNDESVHAGVHRWRIDGVDQMRTLESPIEP